MILLRRRRCFENAKPRRSAGGAQLNRSLGEFEGPIRDLDLKLFATNYQVSSVKSGSGEPPDRAQICAMMLMLMCRLILFFSEPFLRPPKVNLRHRNGKMNVKKSDIARTSPSERFVC